jgi:tight adherence protein B
MFELTVLGALFMVIGLFVIFRVDPFKFIHDLTRPIRNRRTKKERSMRIAGKRPGVIRRQILNATEMLESAGMGDKLFYYQWACFILALIGLALGLIIGNIGAALVLAVGFAILPVINIQIRTGEYIRNLNEAVESSLGVVTTAYVQSGDIVDAVAVSVDSLPAPMDDVFKKFLLEVEMIDSNVVKAIQNMSSRLDRKHFQEWCSVLIQCQSDRELRYALPGIVERLSEARQIQMELDTKIRQTYAEFGISVAVILGCIPAMAMMLPDWIDALLYTLPGKIALVVVLVIIFAATISVVATNRPLDTD